MRKVVMINRVSVDGFFAGPNGEIDWFVRDPQVDQALHEGGQADMALFGRVTYQLFESVWPKLAADPQAPEEARRTARELNEMTKVVFSRTLQQVAWENSRLIQRDLASEVSKLKEGNGSDILIFGSGTIVGQLTAAGLIDDYFFIVTPAILGAGKTLFEDVKKPKLTLVAVRDFKSGNVLLHYRT